MSTKRAASPTAAPADPRLAVTQASPSKRVFTSLTAMPPPSSVPQTVWKQVFLFQEADSNVGIEVFCGKPTIKDKALIFHVFAQTEERKFDIRLRRAELSFLMNALRTGKRKMGPTKATTADSQRQISLVPSLKYGKTRVSLSVGRDGEDGPVFWQFHLFLDEEQIKALIRSYDKLQTVLSFDFEDYFHDDVTSSFAAVHIHEQKNNDGAVVWTPQLAHKLIKQWGLYQIGQYQGRVLDVEEIMALVKPEISRRQFGHHVEQPHANLIEAVTIMMKAVV